MGKKLAIAAAATVLFFQQFGERLLSQPAELHRDGLYLRAFLVMRYKAAADCLDVLTITGNEMWLQLRKRPECKASDFPGMHLRKGEERLWYRFVQPGYYWDDYGKAARIGTSPAGSPAARMRMKGAYLQLLLDPSFPMGYLPEDMMKGGLEAGLTGPVNPGVVLAHEAGHECGRADWRNLKAEQSIACALEEENKFRRENGFLPERARH